MYDLTVIGAGWAGYNAAVRARDAGLKTCLIERSRVGGTCLNSGCIPTKALIQSAKVFSLIKKASVFGINIQPEISADFSRIQERKDKLITQLRSGMQAALSGIDLLSGEACFVSPAEIKVNESLINTKYVLIATGSSPSELNVLKFDGKKVVSSDDILTLKTLPERLLIVGGGVIGCEFAGLFSALGVSVTLVEKLPQLLPGMDSEASRKITTVFKKKKIQVSTSFNVSTLDLGAFDLVLVCVGRSANTYGLGLEELGLKSENGRVAVDDYLKTNIDNIYAAGDCTGKLMLAHYAAYQGLLAVSNMIDPVNRKIQDTSCVPSCIFTDPEIACVGISEEEAVSKGIEVRVQRFDFLGSGMARILDEIEGFIKVVSDAKSGELLGAVIVGPKATELIAIFGVALSGRLTVNRVKEVIFAHPTLSESIHEALR